jgi:3-deoxy-D-manno-octulosonic-acid transferase
VKENRGRLGERYGRASAPRPPGRLIWVHAASVGETNAVMPMIARLTDYGFSVVFTSTTVTSAEIAAARLPDGAIHQFVPFDIAPYVERFLRYWRPQLAIFVESELWPMMITRLARHSIPQIIVNARLSANSFRNWSRFRWIAAPLLSRIDLCLAQSRQDGDHFTALGAPNVVVTGNLKWDAPPLDADPGELARLRSAIGARPVWVAASTHDGEERIVADAHRLVRERRPNLLTIIVPRHPVRGDAIRSMLAADGLAVAQRSRGEPLDERADIYLADTLGELGLFFRLAPVAFLGNSLAAHGGHNPIEPIRLNTAVLHGPHVHNFAEVYERLDRAVPTGPVTDAAGLAGAILAWLDDPAAAAAHAERAARALAPLTGALEATVSALQPHLAGKATAIP